MRTEKLSCGSSSKCLNLGFTLMLSSFWARLHCTFLLLRTPLQTLTHRFRLIRDLLRPTSVPVWAELTWSFVFGVVEVINIVLSAMAYPTLHCSPSSDSAAQLIRRENPDGAVLGQYSDDNLLDTASGEICTNWSVAFVFFSMLMMICEYNVNSCSRNPFLTHGSPSSVHSSWLVSSSRTPSSIVPPKFLGLGGSSPLHMALKRIQTFASGRCRIYHFFQLY